MAEKYTLLGTAGSTDEFIDGVFSLIHLSDGTAVWLALSSSVPQLNLYHGGADHQTPTLIGTVSATISAAITSKMVQTSLCRDASDNLYVVGLSSTSRRAWQAWTKNAGYSWTAASVCTEPTNSSYNLAVVIFANSCLWVSTSDSIFVTTLSNGSSHGWLAINASLARGGTVGVNGGSTTATFMGTPGGFTNSDGAVLDLSAAGFGTDNGVCIAASSSAFITMGYWKLNGTGSALTTSSTLTSPSFTWGATAKFRVLYLGNPGTGDRWVGVYADTSTSWKIIGLTSSGTYAAITANSSGVTGSFPQNGAFKGWDIFIDPATVGTVNPRLWLIGKTAGSSTVVRWGVTLTIGATVTGVVDGSATNDDTLSITTAATQSQEDVRVVKEPVGSIIDWQVFTKDQTTTVWEILGDWTTFIVQGVVAMSTTASATVGGSATKLATTSMAAVAGATAGATVKEVATVSMAAATSLTTSGKATQIAVVSAAAVAGMTASGQVTKFASVSAAAVTGMTASGQVTELASVAMSALASLTSSAGVTEVDSLVAAAVTSAVAGGLVTVLAVVPMHAVAGATVTVTLVQTFAGVSMTSVSSMIVGVVVATTGAVSEAALASMSVAAAISEIAVVAMSTITGATLAGQVTSIAAVAMAGASGASVASAVSVFASALFMAAAAGAGVVAEGTTFGAVSMSASTTLLLGSQVTEITGVSMTAVGNMFVAGAPVRASSINMLANAAMSVAGVASALAFVSMSATSSAGVPLVDVTVVTAVAMALEASAAVAATAASVGSVDMMSTAGMLIAVVLHVINTAMASAATSATIQAQVTEVIHPARLMAMVIGGRTTGVDRRMVATPTGPVRRI